MTDATDPHARAVWSWPNVLVNLGIPAAALCNRHGPCPACGGVDRFRFDNRYDKGDFFCNVCGPGNGYDLLMRVHGWSFPEARRRVLSLSQLARPLILSPPPIRGVAALPEAEQEPATPSWRVKRIRRDRCAVANCDDAVAYLISRRLWPLPKGCTLRAHATVEYWEERRQLGRYPALLADVVDVAGELVTCHVTYLRHGQKIETQAPRKILGPMTGRTGCAVRLMPAAELMGVAEGIETALSAAALDRIPVWAAPNAGLLAKFEPPPGVLRLRVYADRDEAGVKAAARLTARLRGRMEVEVRTPPPPAKDWNDVLVETPSGQEGAW